MKYFHYAVSIVGCVLLGAGATIFFDHGSDIAQSASSEAVWATSFISMLGLIFVATGIFARINDRLRRLESLLNEREKRS